MWLGNACGAAHDFNRTMSMCDGFEDELNDFTKQLEAETVNPGYRQFLLFNLRGLKRYKPHKKEEADVEQICGENEDSDEVSDPQYELFFESLKKYEKSYVLEGRINDVSVCVKYEGESKFGGKRVPECASKMRKDIGRVDGAADQSPKLSNERVPVNQHASDNGNEILKKKPDPRNKGIIKESEVGFSKPLSKRMNNLGSCKVSKNITFVQADNIVTDNQGEPRGQARLRKTGEGEDVAKAHYVPDSESVKRISCDGNQYQSPNSKNNSESKNQSEPVGQAQPVKRKKVLKGKNVVLTVHNLDDEKHLYIKSDPKHNSATKYQVDHAIQVVPGEEDKDVQSKSNLPNVMEEKNVVTNEQTDMAQIENKQLFHKPCQKKYQVTENCIDQARPKQSLSMFMKEIVITEDSDSDVEILDMASFYRAGNQGSIVPSKKFHKSAIEDDDIKLLGSTSLRFDFRKQVMNVLQKPYDKQESKRLLEAFDAGSYVKFHSKLVKILAAHRWKKGKCLAILRGFFFWLENLTQEGSFKPWEDEECLGVDPTLL